jgi:hypothetical protein
MVSFFLDNQNISCDADKDGMMEWKAGINKNKK